MLYPRLGAEIASLETPLVAPAGWWAAPVVGFSGAAVGHAAGRTMAKRLDAEVDPGEELEASRRKELQNIEP